MPGPSITREEERAAALIFQFRNSENKKEDCLAMKRDKTNLEICLIYLIYFGIWLWILDRGDFGRRCRVGLAIARWYNGGVSAMGRVSCFFLPVMDVGHGVHGLFWTLKDICMHMRPWCILRCVFWGKREKMGCLNMRKMQVSVHAKRERERESSGLGCLRPLLTLRMVYALLHAYNIEIKVK